MANLLLVLVPVCTCPLGCDLLFGDASLGTRLNSSDHTVCIYLIVEEISFRSKQHQCRRRRQCQHYEDLAYDNVTHFMLLSDRWPSVIMAT